MVRDNNSKVILVLSGHLEICDSTKAEVMGLLMGLGELKKMIIWGCMVEGDLAVVIS